MTKINPTDAESLFKHKKVNVIQKLDKELINLSD